MARRPLIVVVNDTLMDNHQTELAKKLADDGYCAYCQNTDGLTEAIESFNASSLKEFPKGNASAFACYVDKVVAGLFDNI